MVVTQPGSLDQLLVQETHPTDLCLNYSCDYTKPIHVTASEIEIESYNSTHRNCAEIERAIAYNSEIERISEIERTVVQFYCIRYDTIQLERTNV